MRKLSLGPSSSSRFDEVKRNWRQIVATYQHSDLKRSVWQLTNSVTPYLALWYLAYRLLAVSFWLALPVTLLAAGFMVRVFIIFHDCGHGSFFQSDAANRVVGYITGILTLTPYDDWRAEHAKHHATAGDLDQRGAGDVWTMTVKEYQQAPFWGRVGYRLYRNPFVLLGVAPLYALPRVLQWFSGNIGFHHIHHLAPRIPNYRLPKAYREQPLLQRVDRLTLLASLRSLRLRLYDEDARRLVSFREV